MYVDSNVSFRSFIYHWIIRSLQGALDLGSKAAFVHTPPLSQKVYNMHHLDPLRNRGSTRDNGTDVKGLTVQTSQPRQWIVAHLFLLDQWLIIWARLVL